MKRTGMRSGSSWGVALAALVVFATAANAAPSRAESLGHDNSRPWAKGVSHDEQEAARALFDQGNALLRDSIFVGGAEKYKEALTHWDHPAIHYNLVLALLNLDQPIEVYQHLQKAMQYGAAPLGDDKFQQAKAYMTLVEKQLARVDIRCELDGAKVVMDGRPLFTAPGHYQELVRAGPHTIVATREGYLTRETSPSLAPGKTTSLDLVLYSSEDLTQYKRRWATWIPWTVVGAGAAVALGGGLLHLGARSDFQKFDQGIVACGGCVPPDEVQSQYDGGNRLQTLAIASYIVGGAAIAAGATLAYLNRPQPYRVTAEDLDKKEVAVVPVIAPGAGGVMAMVRF